jgi:hypothetical protein
MFSWLHQRQMPPREIDPGEPFGAKHVHTAHRRGVNAAGLQVGHAAVRERHPRLRQIFVAAENGHAQRLDRSHRRPYQGQHQIEIVNHQIEHHADIGGAAGEPAVALAGDEFRL